MDYTVTSLKNPHTIRGRPTLKDVKCFRNGSSHKFCHLKVLITLKEVNTSDVEKRKNLHEQNFDDEIRNNKQIVINLTLLFKSLILFLFFMMLDTSNEQFDISYITSLDCVSSKIHNLQHAFCPGGGGVLPYYRLYRYVRCQRIWFFSCFGLKQGINFNHFGLK